MTSVDELTSEQQTESDQRVTTLELFFDLVFVFAITQVTGFLADHSTGEGLVQGLFILGALWWAWAAYAWLTNTLNPEEGIVRIAVFASMAAMLGRGRLCTHPAKSKGPPDGGPQEYLPEQRNYITRLGAAWW